MNVENAILESKNFYYLLDGFRNIGDINDEKLQVRTLKDIITTIKQNGGKMKEVFSNMEIFVQNEARFFLLKLEGEKKNVVNLYETNKRMNRLKDLNDSLEAKIETLKRVEQNFVEYLMAMKAYLSISLQLKKEGKSIPKDIRSNFKKFKTEIIGVLNILCSQKVLKDFESLLSASQFQNLESEIKIDERYVKDYDETKYKWLNVKKN